MGIPIFILLVGAVIYLLVRPALKARAEARRAEDDGGDDPPRHEILRLEDYPRRTRPTRKGDDTQS